MADIKTLKNKTVRVRANTYGDLFINVYTGEKHEGTYKFDGDIEGVDLEVEVPKGKRKEYAKIVSIDKLAE